MGSATHQQEKRVTEQVPLIKKLVLTIIGIVILLIVGFVIYHYHDQQNLPKPVLINTNDQPTMGNADAKIHIVAFEDLKCVNCAHFSNNLFPIIKQKYIDTGKAKYTMMNVAFIDGSLPAANAARCLYAQNKDLFFPFVKFIYAHQPPENQDWATIPKLLDFAGNIPGVDMNAFADCLVKSPYNTLITNNLNEASKVMNNMVATPTVYVNGVIVKPLTKEQLEKVINAVG